MRSLSSRSRAWILAIVALAGCHAHSRKPKTDADPAGAWGADLPPAERARLIEADARIQAELAAASVGLPTERLDADARALGLSGAAELEAALDRDCLAPGEAARFAAASGVSAPTAARYLTARFGAAVCAASAP
jgi:hypothetical protein